MYGRKLHDECTVILEVKKNDKNFQRVEKLTNCLGVPVMMYIVTFLSSGLIFQLFYEKIY